MVRYDTRLKNRRVITHKSMVMGIPSRIFFAAFIICGFGVFVLFFYLPAMISFPVIFVLIFLFFAPLYVIHKDDSDAWLVFVKLFVQDNVCLPTEIKKQSVVVLVESGSRISRRPLSSLNS